MSTGLRVRTTGRLYSERRATAALKYLLVKWKHAFPDEPVLLYSELDDDRREVRKVEVSSDGRHSYASTEGRSGTTRLGLEPIPPLEDIARDPQFEPIEITRDLFEDVWAKREG